MWALPTCFWELKNLDRKVCTVSYLMQLTRFANVLPVDALVGQIHDHAKASAEADWQQERNFLVNDMDGECAASALHCYWNFSDRMNLVVPPTPDAISCRVGMIRVSA